MFLLLACVAQAPIAAQGQLTHKGPAANIALSKTLGPYDVVSIRQNVTGDDNSGMHLGEDSLTATNVPLKLLVEFAYDVKDELIFGLSGPVRDARFDVTAKAIAPSGGAPPKLSDAQLAAMIIPLLADRFHLKAHLEPKTLPVYDLIVAKGGPKLKLTGKPVIGSWNISGENTDKVLTIESASTADLAAILSDQANRQVIDKTGLAGVSDVTLKWSDDVAADAGGPDVISIFTAVEEQLGLKLQPSRGPVDTLVIDHAEMPTEN